MVEPVYNRGEGRCDNWIIREGEFNFTAPGKFESLFALGNGYLGVRGAVEERYPAENRGCYLAGLYDRFPGEVTELANIPDWLGMEIKLAGESFSLARGRIINYDRRLNLKDGELVREVEWISPEGRRSRLAFRRFVSLDNYHLAALRVKVRPLNYTGLLELKSGLDNRMTNSGTQHFREGEQRVFEDGAFYLTAVTLQSRIFLTTAARHRLFYQGKEIDRAGRIISTRRQLFLSYRQELEKGEEFELEKTVAVYTSRDLELQGQTGKTGTEDKVTEDTGTKDTVREEEVISSALAALKAASSTGYEGLFALHRNCWQQLWQEMDLEIDGPSPDQLAVRFVLFHLLQMTPAYDTRSSIAAKGLTGEGYKGHIFWDTEIFILPFFIYTFPEKARNLLLYRYHTLPGAREKASREGYRGAMYPWESAASGQETTPEYGPVDVKTGERIPVKSGKQEQHISADIAYACWNYYRISGDQDFLYHYGSEIILETARFWSDRLEYNPLKQHYQISNIMGPDEYAEDIKNNAYTNYLVRWNLEKALEVCRLLASEVPQLWEKLRAKIQLADSELSLWKEQAERVYLPRGIGLKRGLIEQFEGFLEQQEIDLAPYRNRPPGEILQNLSWKEITGSQVVKQADLILLFYLLGEDFSAEEKRVNWDYYEPRTLHDSSLSPGIHAIIAAELGEREKAYRYFRQTCQVDLGSTRNLQGLHAAALGSTWLAVTAGFLGLKVGLKGLEVHPRLPESWQGIALNINWQGCSLRLELDRQVLKITPRSRNREGMTISIGEQNYPLDPVKGVTLGLERISPDRVKPYRVKPDRDQY